MKYLLHKSNWIIGAILIFIISISCNKYKQIVVQESYLDTLVPTYASYLSTQQNLEVHLGRVLFYDKNLSLNNSISCASCHKQEYAFADNVSLSVGYEGRKTLRNSIAIQNLSNSITSSSGLFWDGREQTLSTLIARPIANHIEMGMDDDKSLMTKLNKLPYIKDLCERVYGVNQELNMTRLSIAISSFISQIRTGSNFDYYMNSPSLFPLNAIEERGELLFNTTYQCSSCHHPSFGTYLNAGFRNIGLEAQSVDKGRMNVTNRTTDEGLFRVPDLHNVTLTAPYMHDGRFATLNDVLEHYSHGIQENPNLPSVLKNKDSLPIKMNITEPDKIALVAFLSSMTDYKLVTNPLYSNPFKIR